MKNKHQQTLKQKLPTSIRNSFQQNSEHDDQKLI